MSDSIVNSMADSAVSDTQLVLDIESVTEKRLEQVFEGEGLSTPSSAVDSQVSTPVSVAESAVSTQESEIHSLAESVASSSQDSLAESVASTQTAEVPNLPDAYYRAALHQGYKDEDIKNLFERDPELANRLFAKAYEATNTLSKEFAAIGRAKQKLETDKTGPVKKDDKKPSEFQEIDIEKLRKDYNNDPIVDLIEQQQKQNKQLFDKVANLQPAQESISNAPNIDEKQLRIKLQEEALLAQQVDQFFKSDSLKLYKDFYGESKNPEWTDLTVDQRQRRYNVIEEADAISVGYDAQGRTISVSDAMERAHLKVCEPFIQKAIRDDIKAQVMKRSKSLTLKPTSAKAQESKKPQNSNDLEATTEERLAAVFKK